MKEDFSVNWKALIAWGFVGLIVGIITNNVVQYFEFNPYSSIFYSNVVNVWLVIFLLKLREYSSEYFTAVLILFMLVAIASFLTSKFIEISISSVGWMVIGLLFGIALSIAGVILFVRDEEY